MLDEGMNLVGYQEVNAFRFYQEVFNLQYYTYIQIYGIEKGI